MSVSFKIPFLGANFDRVLAAKGLGKERWNCYNGEEQLTLVHGTGFESLYAILYAMEIKPQVGDDAHLTAEAARGGEGCYFYESTKDAYRCWYYATSTRMTDG
eukprot:13114640-Alexandrium_andersonii.AAC.1